MANCDLGVVDLGSQCFVCTCPSHDDAAGEKILVVHFPYLLLLKKTIISSDLDENRAGDPDYL